VAPPVREETVQAAAQALRKMLTPAELRRLRAVLAPNQRRRGASHWNLPLVFAMALAKAQAKHSGQSVTERAAARRAFTSIAHGDTDRAMKVLILGHGDRSERTVIHRRDHLPAAADRARAEYGKRRTRLDQLADHLAHLLSAEPAPGPDGKGLWTSGEIDLGPQKEWEEILFPPTTKPRP
jgi:hypothetical protein